jgi:hypothetical protein
MYSNAAKFGYAFVPNGIVFKYFKKTPPFAEKSVFSKTYIVPMEDAVGTASELIQRNNPILFRALFDYAQYSVSATDLQGVNFVSFVRLSLFSVGGCQCSFASLNPCFG